GRRLGLCPYYGSRSLLSEADIVALPYSALLCEETRGSLGIWLEGSVVIFDEAHNLVDAVTGTHGSQLSLEQLKTAVRQLSAYFSRFQSRLAPASARNVQLVMRLATSLMRCLEPQLPQPDGAFGVEVLSTHDFLTSTHLDHLNLFPLLTWVRESRLVMKVCIYVCMYVYMYVCMYVCVCRGGPQHLSIGSSSTRPNPAAAAASGGGGGFGARRSSLFALVSFLTALTHPNADGRIVVSRGPPSGGGGSATAAAADAASLRYTVLNAATQFASIVNSARSVVLASGTLSPVEGLMAQLLPCVPPDRVRHFSCGHVVPRENLLALVAARGPTGLELDLRHGRRTDPRVCEELGRLLANICTAVPSGIVIFAPSFAYLDQLVTAWRRTDVWSALTSRKHVFVEPRSAGEVEAVLTAYGTAIQLTAQPLLPSQAAAAPSGAILLCVVGGKLSEGINFGDELGR
ncbi:hypothetical protein VOLCADRAFT_61293, partial [Volvox carteri f. nagariensis]